MPRVAPLSLVRGSDPDGSAVVGPRIAAARVIAAARPSGVLNGRLTGRALRDACRLTRAGERRVVALADLERASGRGTERLLRVARTIADLDSASAVEEIHLDEAAWFRAGDTRLAAAEVV
jgi:magnesium chelatase family protein